MVLNKLGVWLFTKVAFVFFQGYNAEDMIIASQGETFIIN